MKKHIFYILFFIGINVGLYAQNFTPYQNYTYTKVYLDTVSTSSTNAQSIQTVQYTDGMGRPKQEILINGIKQGQDVVSSYFYGPNGEMTKQYLPITNSTQNGQLHNITESQINTYHNTNYAYVESKFDDSPLNRVVEQSSVGEDWKLGSGHTTTIKYGFNEGNSVKKYTSKLNLNTLQNSLVNSGYYTAQTLYRVTTKDEDGIVTEVYKNGSGKTILSRIKKGNENIDTYYVYNDIEQLVYIIPPLNSGENPLTDIAKNEILYQYRYDAIGRLIEKKIPGKSLEFYVYDKENRVVMTTDSKFLTQGKWTFIKYDKFGRVIYTGISNGGNRETEQQNANNSALVYETRTSSANFSVSSLDIYYTKNAYPTAVSEVLSVNYYDTYPTEMPIAKPAKVYHQPTLTADNTKTHSTKTMLTASYVKNLEANEWEKSYNWYDNKERLIGNHKSTHLNGSSVSEMKLDFIGNITDTKVTHKRLPNDPAMVISQRYVYSPQNVLLKHYHKVNNNAEVLLAQNTYDDLGKLINKKVGNNLQSIDYTYNVKGWLVMINNLSNLGDDLFAMKLNYHQKDWSAANTATARYNGSISQVFWKSASSSESRSYDYVYDELNRLTAANYSRGTAIKFAYDEIISYDNRGNIKTLNRYGQSERNNGLLLDGLTYYYQANSNKLNNVADSRPQIGFADLNTTTSITAGKTNDYFYDANGNMTQDLNQGITEIKYNHLNLPTEVIWNSTKKISYTYNATGQKLKKISVNGSVTKTTEYIDGFQYQNGKLQFVPTAEGYVNVLGNVLDDNKTFHYVYNYTDHLGNVRVSYAWDDKEQKAKILNENHFYAFGGKHRGYTGLISTPAIIEEGVAIESGGLQVISTQYSGSNTFHYAYNSKELQTESGFYDYGWRQYMPDIGRWNGIDQLAEHYNSINPYAYVANNPVSFTDPDGRRIDRDINGNYTFTGFDALMLESYLSAGGDYGQLIGSLNSYNGGDFGSGIISHFWLNFKTDVLSNIKINSQLNTVSWIVNDQTGVESNNFLEGVIELKEAFINVGKNLERAWNGEIKSITLIDKLLNLKYYDLASLGLEQSVALSSSYLIKAIDTKSSVNFTLLDDLAKPLENTKVLNSSYKTTNVTKLAKVLKTGGYALGVIGAGVSVYQVSTGQISKTEFAIDMVFTAIGFAGPAGAAVSLIYFGGKALYEYQTGDKLFKTPN